MSQKQSRTGIAAVNGQAGSLGNVCDNRSDGSRAASHSGECGMNSSRLMPGRPMSIARARHAVHLLEREQLQHSELV